MTKQYKKTNGNMYDISGQSSINIKEQEKINEKKRRERENRIKQKKEEEKKQFDLDTEKVMGMTNKNNQRKQQEMKKQISKKQMKIERKKRKVKRIIKLATIIILLACGIIFALVSPIFDIKDIQVTNNSQISAETIVSLSQLQIGQNLFRFNKSKVEKEIKINPYIEDVTIKRNIPNKIEILITERNRSYNVEFLNGYAYINNQGYILEISEEKLDLPVIQGISTEQEQIVEGNRLNTEDLEKLETIIKIMNICKNYELDKKISSINIENKSNYIIYMEQEKKMIYLGDDSNLNNKMLYVPTILQENQDKEGIIYLNGDVNNGFKPRFREKV